MSASFCPNCGNGVKEGAKFCEKCGYSTEAAKTSQPQEFQPPQQQPPPGYQQPPQQQPYYQPSQPQQPYGQPPPQYPPPYQQGGFMGRFAKPPDYIRPPNYVFTETMSQRIIGTMKLDVHVVEEIEDRPELQDEAQKLLIFSLVAITLINIISIFSITSIYTVESEIGTIIQIILMRFVGGFVYIFLLAKVGQRVGGFDTKVDQNELMRVLSYAYFALAISEVISLISDTTNSSALTIVSGIYYIYTLILFAFVIRRALDKGYGTAILTIIISFIIIAIYQTILLILIEEIFGTSYTYTAPT